MRQDIAKQLVERPRKGRHGKNRRRVERQKYRYSRNQGWTPEEEHDSECEVDGNFQVDRYSLDNAPKNESPREIHIRHYSGKLQSEYFPPLLGFLRKNVGRCWDNVNSEIRQYLNPSSTVQKHVLDHLYRDFVLLKPHFVEDQPKRALRNTLVDLYFEQFYVDQKGFLRQWRKRPALPRKSPTARKRVSDFEEYRMDKGIWYSVRYEHLHDGATAWDAWLKRKVSAPGWIYEGTPYKRYSYGDYHLLIDTHNMPTHAGVNIPLYVVRVCVSKHQCSRKIIHREELNNFSK